MPLYPERSRGIFGICFGVLLLCVSPALAAPDAVEMMKGEYAATFQDFPPARKCAQEDAKGAWKSIAVLEKTPTPQTVEQEKMGAHHLAFGDYSRLVSLRTPATMSAGQVFSELAKTPLQYIMTAAGMLYIYQNGKLQSSLLCFVSTDGGKKYAKGHLMLALPVEKAKPLSVTLYEPLK